jgi:hypothetical protein
MKGVHAMANIAKARKAEITRTNRKEAKAAILQIREMNASLRKLVAELRTKVFVLERENKRLKATIRKSQVDPAQHPTGEPSKARRDQRI